VTLTQVIKDKAYQMGFSLVGITNCEPLPHEEVFTRWLEQGRHGQMSYMETLRSRQCRANPSQLLEECRSVLVLGIRYPRPISGEGNKLGEHVPFGRLAAYAWGNDYHAFLPNRLKSLVGFIEGQLGHSIPNRWYTDTGPILERELAQRAGLGWIGKNTCLINPDKGSYFLLAEILLGVELEPDQPFTADRCGSCTQCIHACPTGCILPNRTIDARHCISYLTIELKGMIPEKLRPIMGSWVFGCDVCQQVCPWNRFAEAKSDPAFDQLLVQPTPDLLEELSLSDEKFNHKYQRSPLKRPKRRGYLRNVAVALGNMQESRATTRLVQILHDESEPLVRAHAAWALGQIGGEEARLNLERALGEELDPTVKQEIHNSLFKRQ
jgi:epoxyqueuosine reductase